jgi:hypothetical protein
MNTKDVCTSKTKPTLWKCADVKIAMFRITNGQGVRILMDLYHHLIIIVHRENGRRMSDDVDSIKYYLQGNIWDATYRLVSCLLFV